VCCWQWYVATSKLQGCQQHNKLAAASTGLQHSIVRWVGDSVCFCTLLVHVSAWLCVIRRTWQLAVVAATSGGESWVLQYAHIVKF
jgi:hypothetical protein